MVIRCWSCFRISKRELKVGKNVLGEVSEEFGISKRELKDNILRGSKVGLPKALNLKKRIESMDILRGGGSSQMFESQKEN